MKCLEDYTIEQVKELSREELAVLWDSIVEERKEIAVRTEIVNILEITNSNKSLIEN